MGIRFKDIVIFLLGILGSVLAGLLLVIFFNVDIDSLKDSIATITIMIVLAGVILWIFQRKIDEINVELEEGDGKQNELENALKRSEDLIDIKAESKYIKDKILKLEERMEKNGG